MCELLLSCERQQFTNKEFWIESFRLIRKLISGVDYKGVREIMKGCRDKIQVFPQNISSSIAPQMEAVESVIEHIFNRSACLLPAYFIANEIQKSGPLHWKIAELTTSFVEDFRHVAQMVSIIGHSHMLPIVEHFGYTDSLINPWRLDSTTLKFTFRGILPYDAELFMPQTKLLRYILEQPYSKDMVCSMLNLQKQHKQRCSAVEEQLVWLIMSAMERSEQEVVKSGDTDDTFSNIHWLWVHISSQLIYFVLLQFANFPNIVTTLHDRVSDKICSQWQKHLSIKMYFCSSLWWKSIDVDGTILCGRCFNSFREVSRGIRWAQTYSYPLNHTIDGILSVIKLHVSAEPVWRFVSGKGTATGAGLYKDIRNPSGNFNCSGLKSL